MLRSLFLVMLFVGLILAAACGGGEDRAETPTAVPSAEATEEPTLSTPTAGPSATPRPADPTSTAVAPEPTVPPLPTTSVPPPVPTEPPPPNCDPSYPDVCIPVGAADYDCAGGTGNGPNYIQGPIRVLPPDPHSFDGDGDGVGCES